jgi:hypothetical protein
VCLVVVVVVWSDDVSGKRMDRFRDDVCYGIAIRANAIAWSSGCQVSV